MAVRTPSQPSDKNRRQRSADAPQTVREIAEEVTSRRPKLQSRDLGDQLEDLAHYAGRFWRALNDEGLPPGFRVAMFDNWQRSYWPGEDASVTDDANPNLTETIPA